MTPEQLQEIDSSVVWHPFTAMQAYADEHAPIISEAEGFELIDVDRNRYLDGTSALWCNIHGHRVPAIDTAIRNQLDRVAHSTLLGLGNVPSIELAQRLVEIAPPGLNHVFYSDNGSTAVEAALKIALQYHRQKSTEASQRTLFIALSAAYHGDTIGSVSLGGIDLFHGIYGQLLFPVVRVPAPVAYHRPAEMSAEEYLAQCYAQLETTIRDTADKAIAFVIEPLVQAAAGILVHPAGYLRRVRELTQEYGIPLIVDEVATGFGRTGTFFACEQEQVSPDFLCLSKGITGGYMPLAATLTTTPIYREFLGEPTAGRTFYHGHTYTGNPLGCAAALASLELFERNDVLKNIAQLETVLEQRLAPLTQHPHVGEIRRKGLMVGIELVADRSTGQSFAPPLRIGHQVTLAARRRGAIIRPLGDVIVLMPAPAMPAATLHRLCDITFESIDAVLKSLG